MTFHPLEYLHRLHDGYRRPFIVAGRSVLLLQSEGAVYVIGNRCPHMNSSLERAQVEGGVIRCPAHRFEYFLSSGLPARQVFEAGGGRLERYPISYEGNQVGIVL